MASRNRSTRARRLAHRSAVLTPDLGHADSSTILENEMIRLMALKTYSDEFRRQAVDLYLSTPGATFKDIAAGNLPRHVDQLGPQGRHRDDDPAHYGDPPTARHHTATEHPR